MLSLKAKHALQVTGEKEEALRLNEALLREHEELQQLMAQESSRHHNAEVCF